MSETTLVADLFRYLNEKLELRWLAGENSAEQAINTNIAWGNHPKVVGHMNLVHPNRVQVLGEIELGYLAGLEPHERHSALDTLFASQTTAVVVASDHQVPEDFLNIATANRVPLWISSLHSHQLVSTLRYQLANLFADKVTLHGVFMEVISVGVLLTGESAVGKSELALELITRGHRLIADDAAEFARITPDIVSGHCPPMLRDFLEVRGLGILNIREMYGDGALKGSKYLRLIINLTRQDSIDPDLERLGYTNSVRNVLGVDIPVITLQMAPGRNLAVMVEAAVRNHKVLARGYDANEDLIARQRKQMKDDSAETTPNS
ncbi:HPr kinase/phosphorylase [gamma proteobacterium HTCC5015]|nr:HPr kinase/phosphorylase [gamma proteobacterium HTCC5015]